jgi:hypothetical protein
MPPIEYFIVCRSIQTDVNTNEMSFINVLEDITPEDFPCDREGDRSKPLELPAR